MSAHEGKNDHFEELKRKLDILQIQQISVAASTVPAGVDSSGMASAVSVAALCKDGSVWLYRTESATPEWIRLPDILKKG